MRSWMNRRIIGGVLIVIAAAGGIGISTGGITPVPNVARTPTPTSTVNGCPAYPSFPDANCTGWQHTGVTLTTVSVGQSGTGWSAELVGGNPVFYIRSSSAVVDSLNIEMPVKVLANNVSITRSRIAAAGFYTVNVSDPPTYYTGLTLTDVEIDGLGNTDVPGIAVMGSGDARYTRLNVHGFMSSGPRLAPGAHLVDSYIHGFVCNGIDHSAGTSANDGGSGFVIDHNNIDIGTGVAGCASAAIALYQDFGVLTGASVTHNLMNGGSYCLYTAQNQGATNVKVENNHFGRSYFPNCGSNGPAAQVAAGTNGNTFTGNVWHDTLLPVS